jgi:hypothetical protein
MRCEIDDPYTGSREKINHDGSEVRSAMIHQSDGAFFTDLLHDMGNRKMRQKHGLDRVFEEITAVTHPEF